MENDLTRIDRGSSSENGLENETISLGRYYSISEGVTDWRDAVRINIIAREAFPEMDFPAPMTIRERLALPSHRTWVARDLEGNVVGFLNTFQTYGAQRIQVEYDLLAVRPKARQKGVASALIRAAQRGWRKAGMHSFRAVVRERNLPAEKAFSAAGFTPAGSCRILLVYPLTEAEGIRSQITRPDTMGCIGHHGKRFVLPYARAKWGTIVVMPVCTIGYVGTWIEELKVAREDFSLLRRLGAIARDWAGCHKAELIGMLVDQDRPVALSAFLEEGYHQRGWYRVFESH